jgi:hypothetical protein
MIPEELKHKEIEGKIRELENEIEKLKTEKKRKDELPVEQRVAEFLHDNLCHFDHTEGCSWFYRKWSDIDKLDVFDPRVEYLRKATSLLKVFSEEQIIEFVLRLKEKIK